MINLTCTPGLLKASRTTSIVEKLRHILRCDPTVRELIYENHGFKLEWGLYTVRQTTHN